VNVPPLMLYVPPVMLMGVGMVVPVTVMALEVWTLDGAAPVTGVKEPCNTGCAPVVTANVEDTPPMVRVAESDVLKPEAAVSCNCTSAPGETTPATEVKAPPLMLYWPPALTLMGEGTSVFITVMTLEICTLEGSTLMSGVKLKVFGIELIPVPPKVTVEVTGGEAVALLMMVSVPLRLPSAVGVNITLMVQEFPAASVAGQLLV